MVHDRVLLIAAIIFDLIIFDATRGATARTNKGRVPGEQIKSETSDGRSEQTTPHRVALGGFSCRKTRDDDVEPVMDRVEFLRGIVRFMDNDLMVPTGFADRRHRTNSLAQNYANPFSSSTVIRYELARFGRLVTDGFSCNRKMLILK